MRKLIIFDADGTLTPYRPTSIASPILELLPGVSEKCRKLHEAGFILVIASNQSARRPYRDIRRQLIWTKKQIEATSFHYTTVRHRQKPRPWLLLQICQRYLVRPANVTFVGDQKSDQQAAVAAGMRFVLADDFFSNEGIEEVDDG